MPLLKKQQEQLLKILQADTYSDKVRFKTKSMSRIFAGVLVVLLAFQAKADEGMWMLPLLEKLNIEEMKRMGFELDASDVYNPDSASIKDAVVIFGGGCTGEMISDEGLVLTNHHCGYGSIQALSSVEHDYLKNGFWAMNRTEELPAEGLSVTFIRDIFDVTDRVLASVNDSLSQFKYRVTVDSTMKAIKEEYEEKTNLDVVVKSFYSGNQYFAFVTEKYLDVRLVGTPPSSIGKFGADTDNWMWPRHTGDFSMFRVYADKDGNPAEYSSSNVPLKPKYHLPISLRGVHMDDFAMTVGFPGSTNRYLSSWGIEERMNIINEARIVVRKAKQDVWLEDMQASDKVRIAYASKYARSSNYYKNSIGMNRGLNNLGVLEQKRTLEAQFAEWAMSDPQAQPYKEALTLLKDGYNYRRDIYKAYMFFNEAFVNGTEIFKFANSAKIIADIKDAKDEEEVKAAFDKLKKSADKFYKDYSVATDRKTLIAMLDVYAREIDAEFYPEMYRELKSQNVAGYTKYADQLFKKSIFTNPEKLYKAIENQDIKAIVKDPAYTEARTIYNKKSELAGSLKPFNKYIEKGNRLFEAGLHQMNPDKVYYPDANFSMRMSMGQVGDYIARDAVHYSYFTTLKGVMEKEDSTNWEFVVPHKLKDLYQTKDYGQYADTDGTMHVCFTSNNDITGGNSGSPVINGRGELFGLAFDGNWEAMSGDIAFEPELQKCINVDIRYVLFIIDKFAGASHLIDEMTLVK